MCACSFAVNFVKVGVQSPLEGQSQLESTGSMALAWHVSMLCISIFIMVVLQDNDCNS